MIGNPCVDPWLAGYEQWISQSTRVAWLRTAMRRDAKSRVRALTKLNDEKTGSVPANTGFSAVE